jgi:hypothetical protein
VPQIIPKDQRMGDKLKAAIIDMCIYAIVILFVINFLPVVFLVIIISADISFPMP